MPLSYDLTSDHFLDSMAEICQIRQFLIARFIQLENGGFSSTECKILLYLLDMSSKVYKMNFLDKIDKKKLIK